MKKIRAIQVLLIFTVLIFACEIVYGQTQPQIGVKVPKIDFGPLVQHMLSRFHPAFLAAISFGLTAWAIGKVYKEFKSFGQPQERMTREERNAERKRNKAQERLSQHFNQQRNAAEYERKMEEWHSRKEEREEANDWYDRDYKY